MRQMAGAVLLLSTFLQLYVVARQIYFSQEQSKVGEADWAVPTDPDDSSHLVFNSLSSLLQHWGNTRYRNGIY